MPRDSSGNYTLPTGNPVVDGSIIDVNWANPTMSDIALQLNEVVTRDGKLGPTGPLKLADGTLAFPGVSWNSQPSTGWYLSGGSTSFAYLGAKTVQFTPTVQFLTSATFSSDVKVNGILSVSGDLDLDAGANTLGVITSSTTIAHVNSGITFLVRPASGQTQPFTIQADAANDSVRIGPLGLQLAAADTFNVPKIGTLEIGYRKIPPATEVSGALNATQVGKYLALTGGCSVANNVFTAGDAVTLYNNTAANITISTTMTTFRLAGTGSTGARTLAQRAVATILFLSATEAVISGSGLT